MRHDTQMRCFSPWERHLTLKDQHHINLLGLRGNADGSYGYSQTQEALSATSVGMVVFSDDGILGLLGFVVPRDVLG
jgi:hypothetical protein